MQAATASYRFDIPATSLAQAINRLALQSDRQVLFSPMLARGKSTRPLKGSYSLEAALDRLLDGTGLAHQVLPGGMIVIAAAPDARLAQAPAPRSSTLVLEPPQVEALIVMPGLAEAPAGIDRVNGATLDRSVAPGLRDVTWLSPSLSAVPVGGGDLKLALRGVYGAGEATTPLYFAGLPISGPSGTTSDPGLVTPDLALVDIDRLEVLRGPQGTDHGAGAIGGELRIAPREPVLGVTQGEVSTQIGDTAGGGASYRLALVGNAPLGEAVAIRGVAYLRRTGGYIDNERLGLSDVNEEMTRGARLAVRVRPTDDIEINAFALYQRRRVGDSSSWKLALGPYRSDRAALNWNDHAIAEIGATVRRQMTDVVLTSATAYYDWTLDRQLDTTELLRGLAYDPAGCARYFDIVSPSACSATQAADYVGYATGRTPSALAQRTEISSLVQEFRAEGVMPDGRWVTGLFYERRSERARSATIVVDPATGGVLDTAGYTGLRTLGSRYQQVAAYAEGVHALNEALILTAGVRYAATERSGWSDVLVPNIISGSTQSAPRETFDSARLSARLRAEWRNSDWLVYLQASSGSRPGGINATPDPSQPRKTFGPDTVINYEVGARRSWFDRALTVETAAFVIDVRNMQFGAITPNGAFGYVVNIGSARIEGVEAALRGRLGDLSAEFNAAVTGTKLVGEDAGRAATRGARAGDRIPNIPRYRHVFALSYRRVLPDGDVLVAGWQNEYRSAVSSEFRPDDPTYLRAPSYSLDNLSLSLERGPLTLAASVRNVFNVEAVDRAMTSALATGQLFGAPPRTWSLMLRRHW